MTTVAIALLLVALQAKAQPSVDLTALIECRATMGDYHRFATSLTDKSARQAGMRKVKSANPFLAEYRLKTPITVFGRTTSAVAFTNAGLLAVLDAKPQEVAAQLGVADAMGMPGKFMGERVISSTKTRGITEKVALNVSQVTSHPGKTLAGCTYAVDVEFE